MTKPTPVSAPTLHFDDVIRLVREDFPALPAMPVSAGETGASATRQWLAAARHNPRPIIRHPRIALFLSLHGAMPDLQADMRSLPAQMNDDAHPLKALAAAANAELQMHEMDLSTPSADFNAGPALSETQAAHALAYGMMTVQPGLDLLVLHLPNPVAASAAEKISAALQEGMPPLQALARFGSTDTAAALGAAIAARLAQCPVVTDGAGADIVADILRGLSAGADSHIHRAATLADMLGEDTQARNLGAYLVLRLAKIAAE